MSSNLMPGDNTGPGGPDAPEPNCRECEGTGEVDGPDGKPVPCEKCDGTGWIEYEPLDDDVI